MALKPSLTAWAPAAALPGELQAQLLPSHPATVTHVADGRVSVVLWSPSWALYSQVGISAFGRGKGLVTACQ